MKLLNSLKEYAAGLAGNKVIADLRIGLSYTCALLDDGSTGLAATLHGKSLSCSMLEDIPLNGKRARDMLEYLVSQDMLHRSIGLAVANALVNKRNNSMTSGDTLEAIKPQENAIVGMIGYFAPLAERLKDSVKELFVFEKDTDRAGNLYSESRISELLPSCSIAIITSTTLINNTLEDILQSAKNCRMIALTGASTPLAPQVFAGTGINVLSGSIIKNANSVLQTVSQAGGMKFFKRDIEKVNIVL